MDEHESESDNGGTYATLTLLIQAVLVVGLAMFIYRRDWEDVFLTLLVIVLTLIPAFVFRSLRVFIPPEIQLVAVSFVFLSLFLGSAADFYYRFWWWDIVLHAGSGFLFGMVGFMVLFLLNQTDRLPAGIRPVFLCFFGVTFAVFVGVLWEIFEFTVDSFFPKINMQSTETGVKDTMHDLIIDTLGACIVGLMGWAYFKTGQYSFIAEGVRKFIQKNPQLFRRKRKSAARERQLG